MTARRPKLHTPESMTDRPDTPWDDGPRPLLQRPGIRGVITLFVVFTFVLLTLMSTCSPRTVPIGTTTTTLDGVRAMGRHH